MRLLLLQRRRQRQQQLQKGWLLLVTESWQQLLLRLLQRPLRLLLLVLVLQNLWVMLSQLLPQGCLDAWQSHVRKQHMLLSLRVLLGLLLVYLCLHRGKGSAAAPPADVAAEKAAVLV